MAPEKEKPIVIGIYGVPGVGKSFLLRELKQSDIAVNLTIFEGSEVIDSVTPGGLDAFKALPDSEKTSFRQLATSRIQEQASKQDGLAVVVGHFMFWPEGDPSGTQVITDTDLDVYTHIVYLDVPAETVVDRRSADSTRSRPRASVAHIRRWQETEIAALRHLCSQSGILFVKIQGDLLNSVSTRVKQLLNFFCQRTEDHVRTAEQRLTAILSQHKHEEPLRSMLVFDADKTLAAEDTGLLFWRRNAARPCQESLSDPLTDLFRGPMKYSEKAFHQAALLYAEQAEDLTVDFNGSCEAVASLVHIRPRMLELLLLAVKSPHTAAMVVTCGLQQIWERVLEGAGLGDKIQVIGGGHPYDASTIAVTPELKAHIVSCLRHKHQLTTWAFGDGVVDIPMLAEADHAIVVVGDNLSTSMNRALPDAITNWDPPLRNVRQALFPNTATTSPPIAMYQFKHHSIPVVDVTSPDFLDEIFPDTDTNPNRRRIHHATALPASKILATPQRDARISGHALRAAHHRVGWYLSMTFLSSILGTEEVPGGIPHVQGNTTTGHRLRNEERTLIVALMRGGEPMALGVSEAFPAAGFLHAKVAGDITEEHLNGVMTMLLVDSVVNSGKTVVEFVDRVRRVAGKTAVRIVVVAGVVQAGAVEEGAMLGSVLKGDGMLELVALRMSENKFTGRGGTDTGNRLFNTTRLK
ncbi:uracil phosphoribosyltransferase-domain-containing protein [Cercophora newfieldiana]|uniref:Uracil phosphoribosyltransferase-domain-containing protein n=1 Tax=Cercophora newfieldiana TaxID=92897 RepID=A0AA40CVK4_9PEZI|nr:uracil phosphoribosyltransferase-domain-containing protein [Cercophora newfieldiana]